METERIGVLKDGVEVFNRHRSHVINDPTLKHHIHEALLHIDVDVNEKVKAYTHDFSEVVGEQACVPTEANDEIVFAKRRNRKGLSRFVKNKKAIPTSKVTVVLMKNTDEIEPFYILITGFYGEVTAKEPWDQHAEPGSIEFWNSHALVWGSHPIVADTVTNDCPW